MDIFEEWKHLKLNTLENSPENKGFLLYFLKFQAAKTDHWLKNKNFDWKVFEEVSRSESIGPIFSQICWLYNPVSFSEEVNVEAKKQVVWNLWPTKSDLANKNVSFWKLFSEISFIVGMTKNIPRMFFKSRYLSNLTSSHLSTVMVHFTISVPLF